MINMNEFKQFLAAVYPTAMITIHEFKENLEFIDIDCFDKGDYKLTIELSTEDIKFATASKIPEFDFSLYDYVFGNFDEARDFVLELKRLGKYPR